MIDRDLNYGRHLIRRFPLRIFPYDAVLAQLLPRFFPTMAWGIFFLFQKVKPYRGEYLRYPVDQQLETNFFLG